jgi:hypothetical protein
MKALVFLLAGGWASIASGAERFPSWAEEHKPPPGFPSPFQLSQDYPTDPPAEQAYPWEEFDFKTQPDRYMAAVMRHVIEGNDLTFRKPPIDWYHAPWMHASCRGREYMHGLTMERTAPPQSLHPNQKDPADHWAVGLYNRPGGYTIGQVWKGEEPDPTKADFPAGTVGVKFLFTTATESEVPFLQGSPKITANVYPASDTDPCLQEPEPARVNREMRLLQVDIAVRETTGASPTGWLLGTFIYSAAAGGLKPVGLMWSNDVDVKDRATEEGAFENTKLDGSWVNRALLKQPVDPKAAFVTHLGLGGRVNGPVDNPISSCLSCHGTAARPTLAMIPRGVDRPSEFPVEREFERFFTDVAQGPVQEPERIRLDYSLQLAVGIRNFEADKIERMHGPEALAHPSNAARLGPDVSRDGQQ